MNMLEKAIRRTTAENGLTTGSTYVAETDISLSEITKMNYDFLLSDKELSRKKIAFLGSDQVEFTNKLRDIRTAILNDRSRNVVMITGLELDSGSSFFARNLSAVSAFESSRTSLLVDCNIGQNASETLFNLDGRRGVIDYVCNKTLTVEDIICETGIKHFRCIPVGTSMGQHGEFFSHPRFFSLLQNLKGRYSDRNIFIDAPPILNSADARILLDICDQVVVVVSYAKANTHLLNAVSKVVPVEKMAGLIYNEYMH
ncbi:MAG: hypothetical protein HRU20_28765 [Pseudomonadales bacterium]|nr:hypothetical protein [Pseudomonadales bacterium]